MLTDSGFAPPTPRTNPWATLTGIAASGLLVLLLLELGLSSYWQGVARERYLNLATGLRSEDVITFDGRWSDEMTEAPYTVASASPACTFDSGAPMAAGDDAVISGLNAAGSMAGKLVGQAKDGRYVITFDKAADCHIVGLATREQLGRMVALSRELATTTRPALTDEVASAHSFIIGPR